MMLYSARSQEEIEELKTSWQSDPCWDIEDTEGYEVWHDELLAFRKFIESREEATERYRVGIRTAELGINAALLRVIERLEARVTELEEQVRNLG